MDRRLIFLFLLPIALKATDVDLNHVERFDQAERLIEQWDEEPNGALENRVCYSYDERGLAIQSVSLTSAGEAVNRFSYDEEGRLILHIDPFGEELKISYGPQQVSLFDPRGNSWVEKRDSENRLIYRERKNVNGEPVFQEQCFYDLSGNLVEKVAGKMTLAWEYDAKGRVVKQIEANRKTTQFFYDSDERLVLQVLPNGLEISYRYNEEGNLLSQKSSDDSIDYTYQYGDRFTEIIDRRQNLSLKREYDCEGLLICETCGPLTVRWSYDELGRCRSFTLPDRSRIDTSYEGSHISAVSRFDEQGQLLYEQQTRAWDLNGRSCEEKLIGQVGVQATARDLLGRIVSQTVRLPMETLSQRISYGPSHLIESLDSTLFGKKRFRYDAMDQLIEIDGEICTFDERGNPLKWEIGPCNEILKTDEWQFVYDLNGNPILKRSAENEIKYRYDPLGRLTDILTPTKRVHYAYDPLSRLFSKKIESSEGSSKQFYLYDQEHEIGTLDETGTIQELKVLKEGSAIALEFGGKVYAPLLDCNGSIIALIDSAGNLAETSEIDPFGKEKERLSINPWRFCSKRFEEGLIFFGRRFYDPSIKRWLTPDPAGFVDGPNLYAYVRNSPLNRIDLFGLASHPIQINLPLAYLPNRSDPVTILHCKGSIGETKADWAICCGFWDKLELTLEEIESGTANLLDHLKELVPLEGEMIGLLSYQNGIKTTFAQFILACQSIAKKVPEGTLLIGLHNKTKGLTKDMLRLLKELVYTETSAVVSTREFLSSLCAHLHELNPDLLWGHILHSESGAISRRAIEGMQPHQRQFLKQHLSLFAMGPVLPIPENYAHSVLNIYSHQDFVGIAGTLFGIGGNKMIKTFFESGNCNIQFIPCSSKWHERSFLFVDHAFLGDTYGTALDNQIKKWRERVRLYDGNAY